MLYINQSSFLLITLIAIGVNDVKTNNKLIQRSVLSIVGVSLLQTFVTCFIVLVKVFKKYGFADNRILAHNYKFICKFVRYNYLTKTWL